MPAERRMRVPAVRAILWVVSKGGKVMEGRGRCGEGVEGIFEVGVLFDFLVVARADLRGVSIVN
jgi:hypothetical protein